MISSEVAAHTRHAAVYTQADPLGLGFIFKVASTGDQDAITQPFAYSGENPITFIDPLGLAKVKNESKGYYWYKPDECTSTPCPIKACAPGDTCDVDGIYSADCKSNPYKIVNGCSGKITASGKIVVDCTLKGKLGKLYKALTDEVGFVSDEFLKEHKDWPKPSDGPGCANKVACK